MARARKVTPKSSYEVELTLNALEAFMLKTLLDDIQVDYDTGAISDQVLDVLGGITDALDDAGVSGSPSSLINVTMSDSAHEVSFPNACQDDPK